MSAAALRRSPRIAAKTESKTGASESAPKKEKESVSTNKDNFDGEYKTAFFIDTQARLGNAYSTINRVRTALKVVLLFVTIGLLYWQLFVYVVEGEITPTFKTSPRYTLNLTFALVFVLRILIQMAFFWNRAISWIEVFAEAGGIIPLSLCTLAYGAKLSGGYIDPLLCAVSIALFCLGTWLNLYSEFQRYWWKRGGKHQGRLYTEGLFGYCRHINYFGEVLSFVGYGLGSIWWGQWVPIVMGAGMAIWSVPEIDFYLERKYPKEWKSYVKKVPCQMFPGIW